MNKDKIQAIWTLLDIVHKTVNLPKLKAIHDWAEGELIGIAGEISAPSTEPSTPPVRRIPGGSDANS